MAPACVVTLRGPSSGRDVARGDGEEVAGAVSVKGVALAVAPTAMSCSILFTIQ